MCTVTIVPRLDEHGGPVGLRMLCNRDESRQRPPALPPEQRAFGKRRALLPIDASAGGTWVAVNDAGLALTLLNRNPQDMRGVTFPGRASRGGLIPGLLDVATLEEAAARMRAIDAAGYAPFRLVATDGRQVAVAVGEADVLRVERFPLAGPVMFTSSGLGDALVEPPRRVKFAEAFGLDAANWERTQDAFHVDTGEPGEGELAVCMTREDAMSVSLTEVAVTQERVMLRYHGTPPNEAAEDVELSLERGGAS